VSCCGRRIPGSRRAWPCPVTIFTCSSICTSTRSDARNGCLVCECLPPAVPRLFCATLSVDSSYSADHCLSALRCVVPTHRRVAAIKNGTCNARDKTRSWYLFGGPVLVVMVCRSANCLRGRRQSASDPGKCLLRTPRAQSPRSLAGQIRSTRAAGRLHSRRGIC